MNARRAFVSVVLAGLLCASGVCAQQSAAIVESEGEAKVAAAPDFVCFTFTKSFIGPTLIDTAAQAAMFEKALTQALRDLDSTPARQNPARLSMSLTTENAGRAEVLVAFPIVEPSSAAGTSAGTAPLVDLADKIRKAGLSLQANAAFTGFEVNDRETSEQEAIARASENALYHAEAVGALLEGRVLGVERIMILETRWDGLGAGDGSLSIPPVVQCVARVRISYRYSSAVQ